MSMIRTQLSTKADHWTNLGLTLPILLGYHLGVIFLDVRNAADLVTTRLFALANYSLFGYIGFTLVVVGGFAAYIVVSGKGKKLDWKRFAFVAVEGAVYAFLMAAIARHVVANLPFARAGAENTFFSGLVMSLGAGFYEEVAFRVVLFGLGLLVLQKYLKIDKTVLLVSWAIITALVFSAWHYFGTYGDTFTVASFVYRWICGLAFVAIYRFRGFAPVVWCHALYDIWVLAL